MGRITAFLAVVSLVLQIGCASHSETIQRRLSKQANPFVGKSTDELLIKKGPPDLKEKLSSGDEIWTYRTSKTGERKGWTMTIGSARETRQPHITTWRENINFVISPDGIVKDYSVSVE